MKSWRVPYPKFGKGSVLERVRALAERLGLDLAGFGASGVVIVGSNGKGSTAAMCASLLQQAATSVGLFTSPHLFALNERFRIDGEDITDEELAQSWARVSAAIEAAGVAREIGGFEFLFLIAADWFAARRCAHTIWEAGLGGRLDPVRTIAARRAALTSLDYEHTELLGDTLVQIAREKIDAAPAGAVLFAPTFPDPLQSEIAAYCQRRRVRLTPTKPYPGDLDSLPGPHQRQNAGLALALANALKPLSDAEIGAGLAETRWPGRLERLYDNPLVVIDVGHTPAAVAIALEGFRALCSAREATLVCGVSEDKDVAAIAMALAPHFRRIFCAQARHKGAPAAQIAACAKVANPAAEIVVAQDVAEARRLALTRAGQAGAVYVAGGLFLAAEFKALHVGRDPADLAFF